MSAYELISSQTQEEKSASIDKEDVAKLVYSMGHLAKNIHCCLVVQTAGVKKRYPVCRAGRAVNAQPNRMGVLSTGVYMATVRRRGGARGCEGVPAKGCARRGADGGGSEVQKD